jgi:hypothetical protein
MEILKSFFLGIIAGVAALFFMRRKPVDATRELKKVDKELEEIKEKVHDTDIDDLVAKSNKRYPPGQ